MKAGVYEMEADGDVRIIHTSHSGKQAGSGRY